MSVLLQVSDLAHTAGDRTLFQALELTVQAGDRLALVGHNGSGKTTLLDLLSGERPAESGDVQRRRGLRLARVEQFLPATLSDKSLVDAVAMCGPAAEHWRAEMLLARFRFPESRLSQPVGTLSGGQQNRLMFARALMSEPELLLLDEPTNHLDLATLVVFEEILEGFAGAFLLVSHDRAFLDAVTRATLFLRDGRLYRFAMPYSQAREALEEADDAAARARRAEEAQIDRVRQSAKRLAQWGRTFDNEKFARRARSMEKRAERMEVEKTFVSDGSPLSLSLDLTDVRSRQVVAIDGLEVSAGGRFLFDVDALVVRPGERLALLGHNGVGKSTFIRTLVAAVGSEDERIRFSPQTVPGYYDQELEEVAGDESIMDFTVRRTRRNEQSIRNALVSAGFPYRAHGQAVGRLSGGERARLLFLVLSLNAPNFLIMDEPTNHIDIDGKEELEGRLLASDATLLITSHDRRFVTTVADRYLWIHDGALVEIADPAEFFRSSAEPETGSAGQRRPAAAPNTAVGAGPDGKAASGAGSGVRATPGEEVMLARIVELEDLLEADLARKPRHQKPELQAAWREELEALYPKLT